MFDYLAGIPGKLKTLSDRLTSARALKLDNLDVLLSTRLSSCIKSIQTGYIDVHVFPGTPSTEDAYYYDKVLGTAVNISKTFPFLQPSHMQDVSYFWTARLFSTTVLRVSNSITGVTPPFWLRTRYYVIEFN